MTVTEILSVGSPRSPPVNGKLCISRGNAKLGRVPNFSIPPITTCPGASEFCKKICYATKFRPSVYSYYEKNLELSRLDDFVQRVGKINSSLFRIHVSGDFYSADYVRKWNAIVQNNPQTHFWAYTRCWRIPDIWEELKRLATLPNFTLLLSCDKETGIPPQGYYWAYLSKDDNDVAPPETRVIFRLRKDRSKPMAKDINGNVVCPVENGYPTNIKCEKCKWCFKKTDNNNITGKHGIRTELAPACRAPPNIDIKSDSQPSIDRSKEKTESPTFTPISFPPGTLRNKPPSFPTAESEIIHNEISRFNPFQEATTYATLGVLSGCFRSVVNSGPGGQGKSRSTVQILRLLPNVKQVTIQAGYLSPLKLYETLYKHKEYDDVLIFDEGFALLSDSHWEVGVILRSALYHRLVGWQSMSNRVKEANLPEKFYYLGGIIINTNELGKSTGANSEALLDRVIINDTFLTAHQMVEKMRGRDYHPDEKLWCIIEKRILDIRSGKIRLFLESKERGEVLEFVLREVEQAERGHSFRTLEKAERIFAFFKAFFGIWCPEFAKKYARHYLGWSNGRMSDPVIMEVTNAGGEITNKLLAKRLSKQLGCSLRTAQRRVEKQVKKGTLISPKKGVVKLPASATPPAPAVEVMTSSPPQL